MVSKLRYLSTAVKTAQEMTLLKYQALSLSIFLYISFYKTIYNSQSSLQRFIPLVHDIPPT